MEQSSDSDSSLNEINDANESSYFDELKLITDAPFKLDFLPLQKQLSTLGKSMRFVMKKQRDFERQVQEIESALKKPKIPKKKSDPWDAGKLLDFFEKMKNNESLDLDLLSKKLFMLLALTTPFPSNNIQVEINISEIDDNSYFVSVSKTGTDKDPYTVTISNNFTNTTKSKENCGKVISRYIDCEKICPIGTLNSYLGRTKKIREEILKTKSLFVTSEPYTVMAKFNGWIRDMLNSSKVLKDLKSNDSHKPGTSAETADKHLIDYRMIFEKAQYPSKYEKFKDFYLIMSYY